MSQNYQTNINTCRVRASHQRMSKYYLHYDQVGTLRAVSNSNHNIVKEIVYDTYGNILSDSNPSFKVPFGFAGGLYDSDTQLIRFGYRDYDSFTGKWTAKDPIGFDGGDPVGGIDPSGLVGGSGGIGIGIGGNIHLVLAGGSKYTYTTTSGIVTITCARVGLGIFIGGGVLALGSIDSPLEECDEKGCTKTWSIGAGITLPSIGDGSVGASAGVGPSGIGVTFDAPIGSPGAGLYGGIELCSIETCPY